MVYIFLTKPKGNIKDIIATRTIDIPYLTVTRHVSCTQMKVNLYGSALSVEVYAYIIPHSTVSENSITQLAEAILRVVM